MNKKNNKGFTLVEILAVIVILAIITLLAFTKIRDYLVKSDKNAAETNAKIFVKAVNDMTSMTINDDVVYSDGGYTVSELKESGKLKVNGTLPTSGYVILDDFDVDDACLIIGKYSVEFENGKIKKSTLRGTCDDSNLPEHGGSSGTSDPEVAVFAYTGSYESYTVPKTGIYKIELWGASGGLDSYIAPGAYTSGEIKLNEDDIIYVYVGSQTVSTDAYAATFNGGGPCNGSCTAGGGATDVRLTEGPWNNAVSLASRIMVAAGGSGHDPWGEGYIGAYGGALSGVTGAGDSPGTGATQTQGGTSSGDVAARRGSFGKGGTGDGWGGGGGGGYYGGAGGINSGTGNGGTGASSYISGYTGCVAIKSASDTTPKTGCADGTTDNACSIHYSGKKFTNGVMKAGNEVMPTHDGTSTMTGNSDNGYAKITYLRAG